ncbi:MAG: hypothetical protein EOP38_03075 [Rubrivivax sp.]|nr:MAG: hypothetical protein EOP38_03075 [Rubrivivax sp.]
MITYQRSKFWRQSWFAALIGGLAVGGGVWWWQAHQDAESAAEASPAASGAQGASSRMPALAPPMVAGVASNPTILPDGRPSDFTPEDWAALKAAMSTQANPKAETERVVKYLRFQRAFEQWQALADSRDVQQRQQLANHLLGQLPDRMAQGEVTMGEALLLSTALLNDVEPDEKRRAQRLEEMRAKLTTAGPRSDEAQVALDNKRKAELDQLTSAIVAAYQAQPESRRDQHALERDLDAARRSVYGNTKP